MSEELLGGKAFVFLLDLHLGSFGGLELLAAMWALHGARELSQLEKGGVGVRKSVQFSEM